MEKEQRNALRNVVVRARRLLEKEFQEQLEGAYNVLPDGRVLENAPGDPSVRARLLGVIQHHRAGGASAVEAVERTGREAAFTVLNRFAALKMAERRGLVRECVSHGLRSEGMRELAECAPGLRAALEDGGYRLLLETVIDEISLDLNVLFDRRDSMAQLWPRPKALDELLETLSNDPQLTDLWSQDEAIGWIYQYFNDNDVKEMREAAKGGAPRNSRELAVRNQFFTPRYVVEFLTDNTIGRIWYEMRQGQTRLTDQCRYLVRRPTELFLQPGEAAPEQPLPDNLSQEQFLQQPHYVAHRRLKDPREIRMLDPACGSMHFGLYAFDLFEVIYDEAWEIAHESDGALRSSASFAPFISLVAKYPDKAGFVADVPRLIIEHNLHGIDIDPRCTQIAGLSLWLRAQRTWQRQGLRPQDRPRILRSNIACAEPMPGEKAFLDEFIEAHLSVTPERKLLGQLVRRVFDAMRLAGEAGSLLEIEEEIARAVADAKQKWLAAPKDEQGRLFADDSAPHGQQELALDVTGITDETFWGRAEERIYSALEAYAEQAELGGGYQRRLFADDAARGFAFIDLCRKRYDVILMNPPFGLSSRDSEGYLQGAYPSGWVDLYACFVWRGIDLAPSGVVGAITSRSFISSKKLKELRASQVIPKVGVLADLGKGVMDAANVEACAYTLGSSPHSPNVWAVDLRRSSNREERLKSVVDRDSTEDLHEPLRATLLNLPNSRLLYSVPIRVVEMLRSSVPFEPTVGTVRCGLTTFDDVRFIRGAWEVRPDEIGIARTWERFEKGGEYGSYYGDIHLVIKRRASGAEMAAVNQRVNGQTAQSRQASKYYYRAGAYYTDRSQRGFAARALPAGCVIAGNAPAILSESAISCRYLLGWANSRLMRALVEMQAIDKKFYPGFVKALPWSQPSDSTISDVEDAVNELLLVHARYGVREETDAAFLCFWQAEGSETLRGAVNRVAGTWNDDCRRVVALQAALSEKVDELYDLKGARDFAEMILERDITNETTLTSSDAGEFVADLVSYVVGGALGRWDVRFPAGEEPEPELSDPFAPLPACPPGQLQNEQRLPITKEEVEGLKAEGCWDYPIEIPWNGILLDDPGHPLDLEGRAHQVLQVIWKDRREATEREACEILGVRTLRDYFRKPAGFFADHLRRYSKSRRKAPIYWPLSTASGFYTVWIYYHRLTADTLFQVVAENLDPKLRRVQEQRLQVEAGQSRMEGREAAKLANQVGELAELEQELEEMKAEVLRVAELPYKPDLDDGVQITAAPLWRLFRLPAWRSVLKETWENLQKGEYDWARLSYAIWPDRVRGKCKTDRSLAVAHGLEDLFEGETKPKMKRGRTSDG